MSKYVYAFDEGNKDMKDLLGGKGANLAEMTALGIPVPFGFTITTKVCGTFSEEGGYPAGFGEELESAMKRIENKMEKKFGDKKNPLLVSVRSGAAISMPGMMDTVLNLGLNDDTVKGLAQATNNERFAYDAYRRFLQMFGDVVMNVDHAGFEDILERAKKEKGVVNDTDLEVEDLKQIVMEFKKLIYQEKGENFPESPQEQLKQAIEAVFKSWDSDRAVVYRKLNSITGLRGTAVNVQAMVFGNMGDDSGTGVAFTRNPSTGKKEFYGEFLMNAQGEDVVAGIRTPKPITELEELNMVAYRKLLEIRAHLERHYKDMQDIEFTIERGRLYLLQTRSGKRTAEAAVKIACDMVDDGIVNRDEALLMVDAKQLSQLLHPQLKKTGNRDVIAKGLPASPGAACGKIVFTADDAMAMAEQGESVILVRKETSPEDIHGMNAAKGILTARGGMTSHAAVVARGMGKCCITGAKDIMVNVSAKKLIIDELVLNEGDVVTLDGSTGEVMQGEMEMQKPDLTGSFSQIMEWADQVKKLRVRTNADTPTDCQTALDFGAEGVGLCRTEHMFFDEDRIHLVRQMILAKSEDDRKIPLGELQKIQKEDFKGIFEVMAGRPVTVRLLDPPLHEFLPHENAQIEELANDFNLSVTELRGVIESLSEVNPMLGRRGCRLGITMPDVYAMQVNAICQAAIQVTENGGEVNVEIEVPLVSTANELKVMKELIDGIVAEYGDVKFKHKVGTMVELPRACLTADDLAEYADFFSFGTNDLTQMTFGLSRDDMGTFVPQYIEKGVYENDPMSTIDKNGVGKLMQFCVHLARQKKEHAEIGICGEQGGDPESVYFCHKIGLNYVSCSPYRVPIARLAAAQAVLQK